MHVEVRSKSISTRFMKHQVQVGLVSLQVIINFEKKNASNLSIQLQKLVLNNFGSNMKVV